jgi:CRISPR-associated protein Csb2
MLSRIPNNTAMVRRYTNAAITWATVTPVVLPGHDDPRRLRKRLFAGPDSNDQRPDALSQKDLLVKLERRIDYLLRKSIRQAGYTNELAEHAEIEWRAAGFLPGTELATKYVYPDRLRRFRRLHVQISWRDSGGKPIRTPGPICLGGGRFRGLGLFVGC